ncbi:MAG TPA: MFS transporter [Chloroflexota bacterium]|nr:MFS transporter [Chloroflexota bacterium]
MDLPVTAPVEERLFTADFIFATLANFFNSFGQQMVSATLPVYVLALGGSDADAGLVTGALAFTALLLRPLIGWLADTWRRRPLVLIGTSCYGLASIVYLLAGSVPVLVLGRILHGYGLSNYTTAANAYLADIAPPRRRAEAIGFYAAAADIGLITGPAVGFFIIALLGFHRLFYLSAGLAFTAFVVSIFAREKRQKPTEKRPPWSPKTGIVALDALPIAWTAFCLGCGFGPVNAFISIFAESRGIGNPGLYFTVQALALMFSRTFSGRLADRRGRAFVMIPGLIISALALALLPLAHDLPRFMLSAALFGMGFGATQPATMALVVDRVPAVQRGLAMSTYFMGFDSGISLGSIGLGVLSQSLGFGVTWPIAAACLLLGLLGLLAARPRPISHYPRSV